MLVGFTLTELLTGVQIRRDPPGLYEAAGFAILSKMGMLLAEYVRISKYTLTFFPCPRILSFGTLS